MTPTEAEGDLHWRLIVFDCDGTLVDSQHGIVEGMRAAFLAIGCAPPSAEGVRRVVGLNLDEAIARLLHPEDRSPVIVEAIAEHYRRAFSANGAAAHRRAPLFPGARELLQELDQRRVPLGIATGKGRRGLQATLESHGLERYFVTLQTADVAAGKPSPEMLHRAMADVGAEPEETLLVGDTVFDMQMAANAAVGAIGVSWGYHAPEDLAASGALRIVDSFTDLMPVLVDLGSKR